MPDPHPYPYVAVAVPDPDPLPDPDPAEVVADPDHPLDPVVAVPDLAPGLQTKPSKDIT